MLASWKDWCRLCASETATIKLESVQVINNFMLPAMQVSVSDEHDETLFICVECYNFVNKLERFKERCEQTNRLFSYLANFSNIEMGPQELDKVRDRYLDASSLQEGEELAEEDLDTETQNMIDIIPLNEIVENEENVKADNACDQLYFKVEPLETSAQQSDTELAASDVEQWEPNEIEYEDVRPTYSDPPSCDEQMDEEDCVASVETPAVNHTPTDDGKNVSFEDIDVIPTLRRGGGQKGRAAVGKKQSEFECDVCQKRFRSSSYLKKHEATHVPGGEKQLFACSFCDKMFSKAINVKAHIRLVHDSDKPFICEECGKAFGSKGSLKEHYIVHTEDRPFQCSRCSKRFKNAARLKTHEDIHNDTLYVCPHCGLQLNTKRTLNMHMVVHSDQKKHKCQYCGNEYKRSKALKAHLILHTGLRPYLCPFCDRTFANGSNCRSHKKKFHPLELAALEAAGGQKPAANIPKLENLQPKSQDTTDEAGFSLEVVNQPPSVLVEVDNTLQKNNVKVKSNTKSPKRAAQRINVANRIQIAS